MWTKRRDEEPLPERTTAAPRPAEPSFQSNPAPAPAKRNESETLQGTATIGTSVAIKGQIHSKEDLFIDGDIEGTLELAGHRLTVGPNGKVQANIRAREVVVMGVVRGNVETRDRITIRRDSSLVGDIKTASIAIEDGAYFKGSIDIMRPEVSKVAAASASPQPAASSVKSSTTPTTGAVPPPSK
jgi:cytoskeletal protein CcmA (bactofilin family)